MSPDAAEMVARALGVETGAARELDGGEVGRAHRVDLAGGGAVVAKTGRTPLTVEARMLRYLDEHGLAVPAVEYASDALLVLEYVAGESGAAVLTPAVERDAARQLAALHDRSAERYGFPFDTLSGPYRQANPWTDSWVEFLGEHRLRPLARAVRDEGALASREFERVESAVDDLDALVPDDPGATLLHGDVWAGNLVIRDGTVRAFLDPACSYGHAEMDLSYAGWVGFSEAFFEAYDDVRGIDPGFAERRAVYALHPLLEHVRYFDAERYHDELNTTLAALGY